MTSNSNTIEVLRKWFNTAPHTTLPHIDITSRWNDFVEMLGSSGTVNAGVPLFSSTRIALKTVAAGVLLVPAGLYTLLTQDLPWYDIVLCAWCIKVFPTFGFAFSLLGEGITIPVFTGLLYYFFFCMIDPTYKVWFSELLAPIQTGAATEYGGLTEGFSFKDATSDAFKLWFANWLRKRLGFDAFKAIQYLVWGYNAFLTKTNQDIYDEVDSLEEDLATFKGDWDAMKLDFDLMKEQIKQIFIRNNLLT